MREKGKRARTTGLLRRGLSRNNGLARRLVVVFVLFSSLITGVLTATQLYLQYRDDLKEIDDNFALLERGYAPSLAEGVWVYDDTQVLTQLGGLSHMRDIERLEVRVDGATRWAVGAVQSHRTLEHAVPLTHVHRGTTLVIGELRVFASVDAVLARIWHDLLITLLGNALKTALVALFVLVLFQVMVGQHLEHLAEHARALGDGLRKAGDVALERRAQGRWRPDALDHLANAMNDMRRGLLEAHEEIAASTEQLQRSDTRFRFAMDAMEEGLWELSVPDWRVTYSSGFARLLGYELEEITVGWDFWNSRVHPEDKVRVLEAVRAHIEGRAPAYRAEYRLRKADGAWIWVLSRGRVVERAADGAALRAVGTTMDITALKTAQEEVSRVNASLEESVEKRTAELAAAVQELDAFSYSVSHDLRAPLRAVSGFARILGEEHAGQLDEQGRRLLGQIVDGADRMRDLIDGLLALARLRRKDLHLRAVDLSALAAETVAELRGSDPGRAVQVTIAPGLVVQADPVMMRSLLQNLVGNAWKYTARSPSARIEMGVLDLQGERVYYVRDNGAGFDTRYADKLFQPFARLHSEKEFPGTGIGLATVHRIVSRHGGRVWTESEVDRGATFYFTLAAKAAAQAA